MLADGVLSVSRQIDGHERNLIIRNKEEVLVSADDVSNGKPDPQPYLKGAELLGMHPAECLVIEDAPAGILSAHAGGMKVIALPSTFPAAKLREADVIAKALSDIQVKLSDGKLAVNLIQEDSN